MRLKMLGSILFVVAALGAVLAGSALATATKTAANWYSGGNTRPPNSPERWL